MKNYPQRYQEVSDQMGRLAEDLPGTMGAFMALHEEAVKPGALDPKTKELIALGIAITVRCDGCIAYHVHDALQAGARRAGPVRAGPGRGLTRADPDPCNRPAAPLYC